MLNHVFHRYMRGTQERGHVLGAVDEIVMTLDDNAMNLQSMAASRFVGPFFEKVQKWEKSLSHISEVVDVSGYIEVECMVVIEYLLVALTWNHIHTCKCTHMHTSFVPRPCSS